MAEKNPAGGQGRTYKYKRYSAGNVEWEYIDRLIDDIGEEKIKDQVYNALVWYVVESGRYKVFEYVLNGVTLVSPMALVALNNCLPDGCIWGQILAAGIGTFAAAAKSFSKLHDKRVNYRRAAEAIKSETTLYINHAGRYGVEDGRDALFVERIENIRKTENASWVKIETEADSGKDSGKGSGED